MVVWQGLGILVLVVMGVTAGLVQLAVGSMTGDPGFYDAHAAPQVATFLLGAAAVHGLARWFERRGEADGHTLFFIPVRYWPGILAVLSVVPLVGRG
jgi:hypothetical protein